ncbi:FecCD family ABC transporter permease [Stackebrandtia nassauensis]|uniref:Transport system permease protein n=1 Tax=Stackebrandtia nassauensis (strain DSM 44728 / CIP 108903 / NRRL B-16338 / NBRC 102104 / LLR-40K-21) TaxID=446470 RepID=D3PUU5_STANL|nr:iron chelate uptake ABC transporter family permease subunit [Stackebrandtia nassauensis]ADD44969.1 transport system permease protein [Stackebrandtia nassauensis DSM 44728]
MTTTLHRDRTRRSLVFRLGTPEVSGMLRIRLLACCVGLAAVTVLLLLTGIALGDFPLTLSDVATALLGLGDRGNMLIVHELRLPRAMLGLLAGAAFAMSGAVFQTMTRNPLASPDMIGISAGASTAVVAGLVLGIGSQLGTQVLGLIGGLAGALVIYLLAWRRGTTGYRIVLVGIGVSWMCVATTDYLLSIAYPWQAHKAVGWLVGSLNDRTWDHAVTLMWAMAVLVPATVMLSRWSRDLQLGDRVAIVLGTPLQLARLLLVVTGVGLVAFATAATGPILFVALAAPQIARRLAGMAWPPLLASGLTGSAMVLAADLVVRKLVPLVLPTGSPLPVGVATAALAAPVLLWLLVRTNRSGSGG